MWGALVFLFFFAFVCPVCDFLSQEIFQLHLRLCFRNLICIPYHVVAPPRSWPPVFDGKILNAHRPSLTPLFSCLPPWKCPLGRLTEPCPGQRHPKRVAFFCVLFFPEFGHFLGFWVLCFFLDFFLHYEPFFFASRGVLLQIESLLEYFNEYAYAQIAIYGKKYTTAAKDTIQPRDCSLPWTLT